jgi:hypothetical protein
MLSQQYAAESLQFCQDDTPLAKWTHYKFTSHVLLLEQIEWKLQKLIWLICSTTSI